MESIFQANQLRALISHLEDRLEYRDPTMDETYTIAHRINEAMDKLQEIFALLEPVNRGGQHGKN